MPSAGGSVPGSTMLEESDDPPSQGTRRIVGTRVEATSYGEATDRIARWAAAGASRYVCFATVNNVMTAHDDPDYRRVINEADLVTADGVPLVWGLRLLGVRSSTRVYGPDLTPLVCERAAQDGIPVGFYGGSERALEGMVSALQSRFPELDVVYRLSPPFRPLSRAEGDAVVDEINRSGARILFVGLGSPKQDQWMAEHRGRLDVVMLGVGAAFDFIGKTKRQAPRWMMKLGLEWLFRLLSEPKRLWKRYLSQNPRFVMLFATQLMRAWLKPTGRGPACA